MSGALLLGVLGGGLVRLALWLGLLATAAYSWRTWQRTGTPESRYTLLVTLVLAAAQAAWLLFAALAAAAGIPEEAWAAPVDRAFIIAIILMLGWLLVPPSAAGRRYHPSLVIISAALATAYLEWAHDWARLSQSDPSLSQEPAGLLTAWDLVTLALAAALIVVARRWAYDMPAAVHAVLAAIAIGALAQLASQPLATTSTGAPLALRLGLALGSGMLIATSLGRAAGLPAAALSRRAGARRRAPVAPNRRRAKAGRRRTDAGRARRAGRGAAGATPPARPDGREAVVTEALEHMCRSIDAQAAIAGLLTPGGDLELWARSAGAGSPRRFGALPLADRPTLMRALAERGAQLSTLRQAPDVQQLFRALGLHSSGPVVMEPIGRGAPQGILVAGRSRGEWTARDLNVFRAIARHTAAGLAELGPDDGTAPDATRALTAIESQSAVLSQLAGTLDGITDRLSRLESAAPGDEPATAAAGTAADDAPPAETAARTRGPAGAAASGPPSEPEQTGARPGATAAAAPEAPAGSGAPRTGGDTQPAPGLPSQDAAAGSAERGSRPEDLSISEWGRRYEQALERVPWGVIVADADDRVVFANEAAGRLLQAPSVASGLPLASLFPDAERVTEMLSQLRAGGNGDDGRSAVRLDTPRLEVELEPLWGHPATYLGVVAALHERAPRAGSQSNELVPALADALRAPMSSILGYSDLLARGGTMRDEQVGRFLHRIDANLARMHVMLNNLLTVVEAEESAAGSPREALRLEEALQSALERAQAQLDEKALSISYDIDTPLPLVAMDGVALAQIIDNLLANATQRSPQGGDLIIGARHQQGIDGTPAVVLSLHDRGPHLASAAQGVIELDDAGPDLIGLTIVRLLAQRQGARAWAENDAAGASFFVRLPLASASGAPSPIA